jgi:hypothetical protein
MSNHCDHFSQFCVILSNTSKPTRRNTVKNQYRDFSRFSKETFNNDLAQIEFDEPNVNNANSIDKIFSNFYTKVNKIVNKHVPLTTCSKRKSKQLLKPWITKGLLKSIRIKNKLFYSGE